MRISKFQQGGQVARLTLPEIAYTPLNVGPNESTEKPVAQKATGSSNKSGSGGNKELLNSLLTQLKTNGLPNDVESFFKNIESILPGIFSNNSSSLLGGSGTFDDELNTNQLVNSYLVMLPQLNKIKFNKEQYDEAITRANANEALDEYAITDTGMMVVMDENNQIKQIRQSEFTEKSNKYRPITNMELANLRANNSSLSFDTNIFNILNNAIGSPVINKQILDIANKIGSEKNTTTSMTSKQKNIVEGLSNLIAGGPDNVFYKITSSIDTQKGANMMSAINYIFSMLPNNSKAVLKTKAAVQGIQPTKVGDMTLEPYQKMVVDLINGVTSNSTTTNIDLERDPNYNYEKGKSNKDKTNEYAWLQSVQTQLGRNSDFVLTPGSNMAIKTGATVHNQIMDTDGKGVGKDNLFNALTKSGLSNIVDMGAAYMGDVRVNINDLSRVYYGGGEIATMYLPTKINPSSGKEQPDLEIIEQYDKVVRDIENNYNNISEAPALEIEAIIDSHGLKGQLKFNKDGKPTWNDQYFKPYLAVNAYASNNEEVLNKKDLKQSTLLNTMDSPSDLLKQDFVAATSTKDNKYKLDDIYEGVMFFPMNGGANSAIYGSGNSPTYTLSNDAFNTIDEELKRKKKQGYINPNDL